MVIMRSPTVAPSQLINPGMDSISIATFRLRTLAEELAALPGLRRDRESEAEGAAHLSQLLADVTRYLERPWDPQSLPRAFAQPPGAPIGEP